jgi:GntR family transcriptional regulator
MSDIIQRWSPAAGVGKALPGQISSLIQEAIRSGRLEPGLRLPAEPDLAKALGVSRTTLRAAVQILVLQGYLDRRHGVGTFVSELRPQAVSIANDISLLTSTTTLIRQHGYTPGLASCTSRLEPAAQKLGEVLDVAPGSPVLHLSRTRTADGKPAIHVEEYLPASVLSPDDLPEAGTDWSLMRLLEQRGQRISLVSCQIKAIAAEPEIAQELSVPVGHPLLLLSQVGMSQRGSTILYGDSYFDSTVFKFQVLRAPTSAPHEGSAPIEPSAGTDALQRLEVLIRGT